MSTGPTEQYAAPQDIAAAPAPVAYDDTAENEELQRRQEDRERADRHEREPAASATTKPATKTNAAPAQPATTNRPPAAPALPAAAPASGNMATVVAFARAQVGKRYVFATSGPNTYDCSGLVMAAYARINVGLPHQTGGLASSSKLRVVTRAQLLPGDIVFPSSGHVAIYVGGGMIVHASNPRTGVKISAIYSFWTARRLR